MLRYVLACSALGVALAVACGSDPDPITLVTAPDGGGSRCVPGTSAACACSDGRTGAQTCGADETYAACACTGSSSGTPDAGDGGADAAVACETERVMRYRDGDGDGHGAGPAVEVCASTPGYVASNDDCDDEDARAFPGQVEFFPSPRRDAGTSFDFDCNKKNEQETTKSDFCEDICPSPGGVWLQAVPACGVKGNWIPECQPATVCPMPRPLKVQRCR